MNSAILAVVIHHPMGVVAGCGTCQTVLDQGEYMIGTEVDGSNYVVGHNPPKTCCGKEKKVPLLFTDMLSAEKKQREVVATLDTVGIGGLRLIQTSEFTQGGVQ